MALFKGLIGDTIEVSWVNSGVTPTDLYAAIYNGSETAVDSATMVSSGNGHYFYEHTIPNTPGFYVAETIATIGAKPYRNQVRFKAIKGEVD